MKFGIKKITLIGVSAFVLITVAFFSIRFYYIKLANSKKEVAPIAIVKPKTLYDLPIDSFIISTHIVASNQTLAEILMPKGIIYPAIELVIESSKGKFDFRRIKPGYKFTFFHKADSAKTPCHLVYQIDDINYLKVSFLDTITSKLCQKEVTRVKKMAFGKIKSSLWKTIQDQNLNYGLAIELSNVFAWSVDFFGIEKGDYFKVIYYEDMVEGVSVGIGKIESALFMHHQKKLYAFGFEQDNIYDYFDEHGQSLRKAFLKAPLKFSRISSRFSNSRLHPVLKIRRPHHGIDYAAPTGTAVYSIGDGRVIVKGWDPKGGGNYLKIAHNSVYTTVYMHLSGFAPGIASGTSVKQAQLIGYVGSTGLSSGPHLDFRVFKSGQPIDPLKIESPPVEPVKPENSSRYLQYIASIKDSLENIMIKK